MWPSSGCHDNFCGKSLGWFLRTKIILRGGMWRSDWFQYRRQIAHWVKHLTRGFDYRPIESVILSPRYNTFIIHINLNIYILLSAMYCAQDQSLTELEILQIKIKLHSRVVALWSCKQKYLKYIPVISLQPLSCNVYILKW